MSLEGDGRRGRERRLSFNRKISYHFRRNKHQLNKLSFWAISLTSIPPISESQTRAFCEPLRRANGYTQQIKPFGSYCRHSGVGNNRQFFVRKSLEYERKLPFDRILAGFIKWPNLSVSGHSSTVTRRTY